MSWTPEKVAERFEECVWVMDRLPEEGAASYAGYWPEIIYTQRELNRQPPKQLRLRPLPDAIDRAEETLRWIHWVQQERRQLVWLRAFGVTWREIAWQTGIAPTSAKRYWLRELQVVSERLGLCEVPLG